MTDHTAVAEWMQSIGLGAHTNRVHEGMTFTVLFGVVQRTDLVEELCDDLGICEPRLRVMLDAQLKRRSVAQLHDG